MKQFLAPSPTEIPDLVIPEREGGYAKGQEMREQILRAALILLIEEGYRAMSMRRVAAMCGLKLGNLTYYYPSREDLVRDLLESVVRAYESVFETIREDAGLPPERRLAELCRILLEDIRTKKTTRIFPELWALSNHDRFVQERVNELYARARASFVEIISEIRPDLRPEHHQVLALFLSASMEGTTIFAGHGKPFEPHMPWLENLAIKSFIDLVSTIRPEEFDDGPLCLNRS